ncbi:hypothetical protein Tco_0660518 [Tanacetum coccineum]
MISPINTPSPSSVTKAFRIRSHIFQVIINTQTIHSWLVVLVDRYLGPGDGKDQGKLLIALFSGDTVAQESQVCLRRL